MHFTLEQYKAFPYVAWALFIGFALFTINFTLQASEEIVSLGKVSVVYAQDSSSTPPSTP